MFESLCKCWRCTIRLFPEPVGYINSIGSSSVTMCTPRSLLIKSIIAASDVDLPQPVGPVTSIRPCFNRKRSCIIDGMSSSSIVGMIGAMIRAANAILSRSQKQFTRNREPPSISYDKSNSRSCNKICCCFSERILKTRFFASSSLSGFALLIGNNSPSIRKIGGRFTVRWISEALMSIADLKILSIFSIYFLQ